MSAPDTTRHAVEAILYDLLLDTLTEPDPPVRGRGRPPVLTTGLLWVGMLVSLLRGDTSQRGIWHTLSELNVWNLGRLEITDDCIYRKLERHGTEDMARLFALVTALLPEVAPVTPLAAFARDIVAMDCSTLSPPRGHPGEPIGKISTLFDVRRQRFRTIVPVPSATENEKVSARTLVASLPPGTLVLMDRGYYGFELFDTMTARGVYWVTRECHWTSYKNLTVRWEDAAQNRDEIGWLGVHRSHHAAWPVRRITIQQGTTPHVYVTNVLSETDLPLAEVPRLYACRWDIEMAFKLIKRCLGLEVLWSAKWPVVQAQLWAVLAIAQVVFYVRSTVAAARGESIFDCSLELLLRYLPRYMEFGENPLAVLREPGPHGGIFRPSRRKRYAAPTAGRYTPIPDTFRHPQEPRYGRPE